jgi:hypothetical protein
MSTHALELAAVLSVALASAPAFAQQPQLQPQACLHDASETEAQAARRKQALGAARMVNNIQANQPGSATKTYFTHDQLEVSPFYLANSTKGTLQPMNFKPGADILPGWKLTLDTTRDGYWFIIKDATDPCGFSWVSNQDGLIYKAEHLR